MNVTQLLDDGGRPSLATAIMMSHHAMRRDLALFASMLATSSPATLATSATSAALHDEWCLFGEKLHGASTSSTPDWLT